MIETQKRLELALDVARRKLDVAYHRTTDRALFDICDPSGRIVQTGAITSSKMSICIAHLEALNYVFLVLDGDRIISGKFSLKV